MWEVNEKDRMKPEEGREKARKRNRLAENERSNN